MSDDRLAGRITELSPEARALLERRLARRRSNRVGRIPRREPGQAVPVTFAQWRLWFLEQLRPGTNAWNTPIAAYLRGPVDTDGLKGALQLLVERHATLRTVFPAQGGVPIPVSRDDVEFALPVVDRTDVDTERRDACIRAFVDEQIARPFDLESELLLRAHLLRLAPEEHVFVLVAHHIACDGWSKGLLLDELAVAYQALSVGEKPALAELPIEYADFAVWQRRELSGERLRQLTDYWKERLAGAAFTLNLPADRPRPERQAFRGAVEWLEVPESLARAAVELGRRERATPFMTLLAAFDALLHVCTGQEDLLVGSPSAMRTHPELRPLIGLFANTLVYRTSVSGHLSFRELVRRVRDTALGVYANQELPFEKIVEAVKPPRDVSRNPLVQVNLRVEGREPELRLGSLAVEPIAVDPHVARFDLAIELGETDRGFAGYLEYDVALFDAGTAAALARRFAAILDAAVRAPDTPIAQLAVAREQTG